MEIETSIRSRTQVAGVISSLLLVTLLRALTAFVSLLLVMYPNQSNAVDYSERNSIVSGDDTFNLIASSGAQVVIFLNSDGTAREVPKDDILLEIKQSRPNLIEQATERLNGAPQELVRDLAIADYTFAAGQYSSSAILYSRILDEIQGGHQLAKEVSGLVTASFYGSKRHVEGLKFICSQYEYLPQSDRRYRHIIHAHLRSLAVNLGHKKAEEIIHAIRRNPSCQRPDFSPVWIPIPLLDMRDLERSVSPIGGVYGISDQEDLNFAQNLLERDDVGFMDYLHFVLGNFDLIIEEYPDSLLIDLALLGGGDTSRYDKAVSYLDEYYRRFAKFRFLSRQVLYRRAVDARDWEKVDELLDAFGDAVFTGESDGSGVIYFQIDATTRVWFENGGVSELTIEQIGLITEFYQDCWKQLVDIQNQGFPEMIRSFQRYSERYKELFPVEIGMQGWYGNRKSLDYTYRCPFDLSGNDLGKFAEILQPLQVEIESGDLPRVMQAAFLIKECGDYRHGLFAKIEQNRGTPPAGFCSEILAFYDGNGDFRFSMHALSAVILGEVSSRFGEDSDKAQFGKALAFRNKHEYKRYAQELELFVDFYPASVFADDALAELGWYHLAVTEDLDRATAYFERVVEEYETENAYDNALNWLVILNLEEGRIAEAAFWSVKLGKDIASDRLFNKSSDRTSSLERISEHMSGAPRLLVGNVRDHFIYGGSDRGAIVKYNAPNVTDLKIGDRIASVQETKVSSALHFHELLLQSFLKGETSVRLRGSNLGVANTDSVVLPLSLFGYGN